MVRGKRNENPKGKKKTNGAEPEPTTKEAAPPKDHNTKGSLLLTDDGERASHYFDVTSRVLGLRGQIAELQDKIKGLHGEEKQLFKEGKACLGFNRKDFERGLEYRSSRQNDGGAGMLEEQKRWKEIADWEEHPIGYQFEINLDPDRTPINDRAFNDGKAAGRGKPDDQGKPIKCDPPPAYASGVLAQRWMAGWHEGQDELMRFKLKKKTLEPSPDGKPWPDDQEIARQARAEPAGEPNAQPAPQQPSPIGNAPSTAETL
jgi:hypothetical protein